MGRRGTSEFFHGTTGVGPSGGEHQIPPRWLEASDLGESVAKSTENLRKSMEHLRKSREIYGKSKELYGNLTLWGNSHIVRI